MGLSVSYEWKTKIDLPSARRLIARFHALALKLPFDEVSEIREQDAPDGKSAFRRYAGAFRHGGLYLSRTRRDGETELVDVPALHAVFFFVRVNGAESAAIGLASHPPVVLHHEDLIERNRDGSELQRSIGRGDPIEFPTRRRGYYSWQRGSIFAPIKERPDFEHLEAKGIQVLKKMAARQRRRRKGRS